MMYQKKVIDHHEVVEMHHEVVKMHHEMVKMHRESKFQLPLQSALPLTTSFVPRSNVYGILCGHCYCQAWLRNLSVTYLKACSHTITKAHTI